MFQSRAVLGAAVAAEAVGGDGSGRWRRWQRGRERGRGAVAVGGGGVAVAATSDRCRCIDHVHVPSVGLVSFVISSERNEGQMRRGQRGEGVVGLLLRLLMRDIARRVFNSPGVRDDIVVVLRLQR